MVEQDLSLAPPLAPTPSNWIEVVIESFDEFLQDHASCEKKASGMAMSVASHYPDQPILLEAMVDLAVEELNHYREVIKLLLARNITPKADQKDPYINQLNKEIRRGSENFLLDRLLVAAIVERRGAERFDLIAHNISEPALVEFYQEIAASESRHWTLFITLAHSHCPIDQIMPRLTQLTALEADIMLAQPLRAALH